MIELKPSDVETVWYHWLNETGYFNNHKYATGIGALYKGTRLYKDFAKFLETYGAYTVDDNGLRYIKFQTPEQATFFILRWL